MTRIGRAACLCASAAAVFGAAYLGACFWQLHEFDAMFGGERSGQVGLFTFKAEAAEGGFLNRSALVRIGLLDEPLLKMKGRFTPGLHPKLEFFAVDTGYPDAEVFLQADPKSVLKFSFMLEPVGAELAWREASVGPDKLGAGSISADFEIDPTSGAFKAFSAEASLARSSSSWGTDSSDLEGEYSSGRVEIGEKKLRYSYKENPRELSLSCSSGEDSISERNSPVMATGPSRSRFDVKRIEADGKKLNSADFSFELDELAFQGDFLPPLEVSAAGRLLAPEKVWIPCIASKLMIGASHLSLLPGVCPEDPEYDVFPTLADGSLDFHIEELKLKWKGASVALSGRVKPAESAVVDVKVSFDESDAAPRIHSARTLTMQTRRFMEDLLGQKAASISPDGSYEMKIEISTDENGRSRILGNGVDLTKVDARLDLIDPSMDSRVVRIVVKRARPELQDEMMSSVAAPLEDLASKSKGTANWISTQEEDGRYILDVVAEDYEALSELVDAFDAELKRIKEEMPEGIEAEMLSAASNSVGTFDD